jgi:hypothetical protein
MVIDLAFMLCRAGNVGGEVQGPAIETVTNANHDGIKTNEGGQEPGLARIQRKGTCT